MAESDFARVPVMVYGANLLGAALAYVLLQQVIIRSQGEGSALRRAVGRDTKGKASVVLYLAGIVCGSFIGPGYSYRDLARRRVLRDGCRGVAGAGPTHRTGHRRTRRREPVTGKTNTRADDAGIRCEGPSPEVWTP